MIEQNLQENGRESADTNFLVTIFPSRSKDYVIKTRYYTYSDGNGRGDEDVGGGEKERRYITHSIAMACMKLPRA